MTPLSDKVLANLQNFLQQPDLTGTRYRIIQYLARGGMGSVWLAEDEVLGRRVALKVLDLVAPAEDMPSRLVREAQVLARLEHPGIVPVHDAGTLPDGRAFYCMKYVEGRTLVEALPGKSVPERLRLFQRIAEPLEFAHAAGFIHRDLKPENIMIGAFGEVLVMDWGLAKVCASDRARVGRQAVDAVPPVQDSSSETQQGSVLGTPGYMSPEQMRGDPGVDHRSDIFSLGALLQHMLTEALPSERSGAGLRVRKPLQAICNKAMAANPGDRYQSAREMIADVAHYLDGERVSSYPETLIDRAGRVIARHQVAVILVTVYLLMRLLFIFLTRH